MEKVIFQLYKHFIDRMNEFYQENETIQESDIVFVGDSIIEMLDVKQLQLPSYRIYNRGIISDKSAGVLMSFDDRVLALRPKVVVLLIGSNDICDGYLIKQIKQNIEDIILKLKKAKIQFVLLTCLPPCYDYSAKHVDPIYGNCRNILKMQELNQEIISFEKRYDHVHVVDAFHIYANEKLSLDSKDTLDGVHLTPMAYEKLFKVLKPLLIQLMKGGK